MTFKMDQVEKLLVDILKSSLTPRPEVVDEAHAQFLRAIRAKTKGIPARLQQINNELETIETELKNLIGFVIRGAGSESVNAEIKSRELRKARLLSETHALRRVQPKTVEITKEQISARMERLAAVVVEHPMDCFPAIRQMFPKKVRVNPKGKAVGGRNLYTLSGRLLLNGGLGCNFERLVSKNKKGAVKNDSSLPPFLFREPQKPGFDTLENGVTNPKSIDSIRSHATFPTVGDKGVFENRNWALNTQMDLSELLKRLEMMVHFVLR